MCQLHIMFEYLQPNGGVIQLFITYICTHRAFFFSINKFLGNFSRGLSFSFRLCAKNYYQQLRSYRIKNCIYPSKAMALRCTRFIGRKYFGSPNREKNLFTPSDEKFNLFVRFAASLYLST